MADRKIVAVTGGRHFGDVRLVWKALDELHASVGIAQLIDGASDDVTGPYVGADYWSHQWAMAHDIPTVRVHAEWKKHGRAAGPIRNQKILDDWSPAYLVTFSGGRGTADMTERAKRAGLRIVEPKP